MTPDSPGETWEASLKLKLQSRDADKRRECPRWATSSQANQLGYWAHRHNRGASTRYFPANRADPWTIWVWTAQIHLHVDFFSSKYYSYTRPTVGWIHTCGTTDTKATINYSEFPTVWRVSASKHWPLVVQGSAVLSDSKHQLHDSLVRSMELGGRQQGVHFSWEFTS